MRITIIGGENIGTLMAAEMAHNGHSVTVYTKRADKWSKIIKVLKPPVSCKLKIPRIAK